MAVAGQKTGTTTAKGDTIQPTVIGTEKTWTGEVAVALALIRYVSSRSQNQRLYRIQSRIANRSDQLLQGFYILEGRPPGW